MVIGSPGDIEPFLSGIRQEAQHLALRLDNTHLEAELAAARATLEQHDQQ